MIGREDFRRLFLLVGVYFVGRLQWGSRPSPGGRGKETGAISRRLQQEQAPKDQGKLCTVACMLEVSSV